MGRDNIFGGNLTGERNLLMIDIVRIIWPNVLRARVFLLIQAGNASEVTGLFAWHLVCQDLGL